MLSALLSPVRIGSMELRNRIAMSAMGVEIVDPDGHAREPVIAYYEERARGGAGLIVTEVCAAAYPLGANSERQLALSDDAFLPGLRELTDRVHARGARIAAQLVHHGKLSRLDLKQGRAILMPSEPRWHGALDMFQDLTGEEVQLILAATGGAQPKVRAASREDLVWLVEIFAAAAERARRAGFDAVEVHGAHGYILSGFLSPAWNHREDEYGGPLENRARLLCEVLRACKERAGSDFPVLCRLDAVEFRTPGGIVFEDTLRVAELAEEAGADAIDVSAYADATSGPGFTEAPLVHREAGYADYAARLKERVGIPVVAVGRIEPERGDRLVREGGADVIAMARKLLADPHLPRKLAEDRAEDVRPCIYCYTCVAQAFFDHTVRCAVNPVTSHEAEIRDVESTRAAEPRRVLVVGGGPAGMEAARVAALRGHEVILCEKSARLGGTLRFAALVYQPNERLLRWLLRQVDSLPIDVRLETEVTRSEVARLAPGVVLVAVGAKRTRPRIAGVDRAHVFDGDELRALLTGEEGSRAAEKLSLLGRLAVRVGRAAGVTTDPSRLREASRSYMPVGSRVVILGGGLVGCELAEFLRDRGREVVVLEEGPHLAAQLAHPRRWRLLHELREAGVELLTDVRVREIGSASIRFERGSEGELEEREVPAETVVLATGLEPDHALARSLQGVAPTVEAIGDCDRIGYLEGAIHGGFQAAARL